jgi:hypothetical protein
MLDPNQNHMAPGVDRVVLDNYNYIVQYSTVWLHGSAL